MSDHKTEKRFREIHENFCAESGCEFEGKHAQQGVCHTTEPEMLRWDRLYEAGLEHANEIKRIRTEHITDKDEYISWLEAMYECTMINWTNTLDECVYLRRELALLKLKLEKQDEQSTRDP